VSFLNSCPYLSAFVALAIYKTLKTVVHIISYNFFSQPAKPSTYPTVIPQDITVIIPTVGDLDDEFKQCIRSILRNRLAKILVSTVGYDKYNQAVQVCGELDRRISVLAIKNPNKREQFIHAANTVQTRITCHADDHVFWPSTYLRSSLAPFEDPFVGIVGTVKRVIRDRSGSIIDSFLNYIACIYLERHNFECTASYNINGSVFVISGRTAFIRTEIIQSLKYRQGFLNYT
jgi:cellulose synthase/poly-beta-1,6-N-acetylglucosamine synthase-like glycosyltransferase